MKKDSSLDTCFYMLGWCGILLAAVYVILKYLFDFDIVGDTLPCTLYTWTGFYCPGCGGTRAVVALLKGNILDSLYLHPFVPYAFFLGGWFMISQTIERMTKGKIKIALHFRMIYAWIAVGIIFLNFIWKNSMLLMK